MKDTEIFDAMAKIDDDLIDRVSRESRPRGKTAAAVILTAAALTVVLTAVMLSVSLSRRTPASNPVPGTETESESETALPPLSGDPVFTAEEIAGLFDETRDSTSVYSKVRSPSVDELKYLCTEIPDGDRIPVYSILSPTADASAEDLAAFTEKYLGGISAALGVPKPGYAVKEEKIRERITYETEVWIDDVRLFFSSAPEENILFMSYNDVPDGFPSLPSPEDSDEAITASLEPVREKLCGIFGVDFRDVSVRRNYGGQAVSRIRVTYYDRAANGADISVANCSDSIQIGFDYSSSLRKMISVMFRHKRFPPEEICPPPSYEALVPLEEAERMLSEGYVFGVHCCPLCIREQPPVDFEDYDAVGIEYYEGVPFYAFFKEIERYSGETVALFAETLVPAVRVSGLEEYFEAQKANHPTDSLRNYG